MQRITEAMRLSMREYIGPDRFDQVAEELRQFSKQAGNRQRRELYAERKSKQ